MRHLLDRGDGASVELFLAHPADSRPAGSLLFVHGNQGGMGIGAREFVDSGALFRFSTGLNITAAAVSQPGFGASEGPADFCGPNTQQAIIAALEFMRCQPCVDPDRMVLYGNSRGAVASAMVAAQLPTLRAVILSSGVYDLRSVFDDSPVGIRHAIEREAGLSDEAFLARSALYHAHSIRSQTVILHGRHDDRAPFEQAERFAQVLSGAGVQVVFKAFECGHRSPREQTREALRPFLQNVFHRERTLH
jgi:dipeptidyl aminopeptidase/acylaminoacyl peptidase